MGDIVAVVEVVVAVVEVVVVVAVVVVCIVLCRVALCNKHLNNMESIFCNNWLKKRNQMGRCTTPCPLHPEPPTHPT